MVSDSMKQIPSISLYELKTNNRETIESLANACEHWGFFRLIDLDFKNGETDQLLTAMKHFFELPHEEKKQLSRTEKNPWGYFDQELTKKNRTGKKFLTLA